MLILLLPGFQCSFYGLSPKESVNLALFNPLYLMDPWISFLWVYSFFLVGYILQ